METFVPYKTPGLNATVLPDGRWLVYDQAKGVATTLTAPAGILWELCDGHHVASSLVNELQSLYPGVSTARLASEIDRMLRDFLEQGLVTHSASDLA